MRTVLTIIGETIAVLGIFTCIYGGLAMFGDHVTSDIALEEMK